MIRELTLLNAQLDRGLTQFAKPGDLSPWSVADSYKSSIMQAQRGRKATAKDYALLRDIHWDQSVPSRKGLAKQLAREGSKPAVFRSSSGGLAQYLRLGKRGAGPLKKLP